MAMQHGCMGPAEKIAQNDVGTSVASLVPISIKSEQWLAPLFLLFPTNNLIVCGGPSSQKVGSKRRRYEGGLTARIAGAQRDLLRKKEGQALVR